MMYDMKDIKQFNRIDSPVAVNGGSIRSFGSITLFGNDLLILLTCNK